MRPWPYTKWIAFIPYLYYQQRREDFSPYRPLLLPSSFLMLNELLIKNSPHVFFFWGGWRVQAGLPGYTELV